MTRRPTVPLARPAPPTTLRSPPDREAPSLRDELPSLREAPSLDEPPPPPVVARPVPSRPVRLIPQGPPALPSAPDVPLPQPPRRRRGLRFAVWSLLVVVLLSAVAAVLALATPLTAVRHVVVTGTRNTPSAAVAATARGQLGTPLLRVDTAAITTASRALPWVVSLRVERRWPHTLVLHVREATAVAALPSPSGGDYSVVDAHGRQIVTTSAPPDGVPVVSVDAQAAGPRAVAAAGAVAAALPAALREQVSGISALSEDDVRLTLKTGASAAWGGSSQTDLKAQVLIALLPLHARAYDVSAPDAPATS